MPYASCTMLYVNQLSVNNYKHACIFYLFRISSFEFFPEKMGFSAKHKLSLYVSERTMYFLLKSVSYCADRMESRQMK